MMDEELAGRATKTLGVGDLPLEGKKSVMDFQSNNTSSRNIQESDLPIEGEGDQRMIVASDNKKTTKKKRCLIITVVVMLLILIGVCVGVVVTLSGGKDKSGDSEKFTAASGNGDSITMNDGSSGTVDDLIDSGGSSPKPPSPFPARNPTPVPITRTKVEDVKDYVISRQISKREDLTRDGSPQDLAAMFMAEDVYPVPDETTFYNDTIFWMERYVATVFYYSMGGKSWTNEFNFLTPNMTTCQWGQSYMRPSGLFRVGIGCTRDFRIGDITLDQNNLVGSLPAELGFLSEIRYFSIISNSVSGTFPDRLKYWRKLIIFDAYANSLSGEIPEWIANWSTIRSIRLSSNELSGTLPSGMKNLTEVSFMFLDDNLFEGSLDNLGNCRKLTSLYLEDNDFEQKVDSNFLPNLNLLLRFDVSDNELTGEVPVHLFSGGLLDVLDIHGNQLTSFPDTIPKGNRSLGFLALQFNPLEGAFPTNTISNMVDLDHLDLTSTSLTGTMPIELGTLTKLNYLFLADTAFISGTIPDDYENLNFLMDLSLKHADRIGPIPAWFGSFQKMILLDLDDNQLSGTIPSVLGNMTRLNFLMLHRNILLGTVPQELGNLQRMQYLFLDHNDLTGDISSLCSGDPKKHRITSDCAAPSNEIICTCCAVCCDDEEESKDCNIHHENDYFAGLEPQWSTTFSRLDYSTGGIVYEFVDFNITD